MLPHKLCIFTFVVLFSAIPSIIARSMENGDQKVSRTIVVDPSGKGNFRTIQAAIDSVPSRNQRWICIDIAQGRYKEQVTIPRDKPFIYLKAAGNTSIEWDAHGFIGSSATFTSQADYTIVQGITFVNSYNSPPSTNRNPMARALAARIQGDKSGFYHCGFFGFQDTLWDDTGKHYFKSCTIEGAVDFIFGNGQSHYESCIISVARRAPKGEPGYITAQSRGSPDEMSGFVFKDCNIVGPGKTFLGRPWRNYARVLFYNTIMSDSVVPEGWNIWNSVGKENQLTLSEYECHGSGAESSKRVKWEKKLSEKEVRQLTSVSFIDDDQGWLNQASNILNDFE